MRGDHRDRAAGVELVEQREGVLERALAHVADVDEYALGDHRADRGATELGEADARLGKQCAVDRGRE